MISFEFTSLNYRAPEKNRYRYLLEGFDDDWTEVGADRRFVTYTNLDPGEYSFRVLGSNNDGVWNEEGASITITITPPWWETWWFRGSLIALVIFAIASVYIWQNHRQRNREQQLNLILAERTQELSFIQSQMNILFQNSPLGIGLASMDGKIMSANPAMASIFGYSEEELLQTYVQDFYQTNEQRAGLLQQLETEEIIQVTQLQLQRKDGSKFYINLTESRAEVVAKQAATEHNARQVKRAMKELDPHDMLN